MVLKVSFTSKATLIVSNVMCDSRAHTLTEPVRCRSLVQIHGPLHHHSNAPQLHKTSHPYSQRRPTVLTHLYTYLPRAVVQVKLSGLAGRFPLVFFLRNRTIADKWHECHPTASVKALKGKQRTDSSQWSSLILSSSNTGLLKEGALFRP